MSNYMSFLPGPYKKLAAAVVLSAIESLARRTSDDLEQAVFQLHRKGVTAQKIAERIKKSHGSVRSIVERMDPDPRQFLLAAENPFIQYCGIDAACLRKFVSDIEIAPERAVSTLRSMREGE